ncbi:unnamed protein product [Effrenium voratum]|uniref:PPPDE domain-containing protein n=1 Tax=Effrenium voratum TaxID=2562239 RepID=A0AA36NND0_9DINO|nr:unnamed protein product [Effrenium voratum]CAJ1411488.1 unnamed protein product [Effrenium voratum]CAJ1456787.1 unnamed protein product [Effrenium voratum]
MSRDTLHSDLVHDGCEELIFDRREKGIWLNKDLGHWSLPGIVRWRYAGAAKLLGETPQAAADQLRTWAASKDAGHFDVGTYHIFDHNCNHFTAALLGKAGFNSQKVLGCGPFHSNDTPCLAPENANLSPEGVQRMAKFL